MPSSFSVIANIPIRFIKFLNRKIQNIFGPIFITVLQAQTPTFAPIISFFSIQPM